MNYSAQIDKLCKIVENHGFTVCSAVTEEFSGRINYKDKTISIAEPSAQYAMLTLLHEMGHMFHYLRCRNFVDSSNQSYEVQAYVYGWAVIIKYNIPVSRQVWRSYNRVTPGENKMTITITLRDGMRGRMLLATKGQDANDITRTYPPGALGVVSRRNGDAKPPGWDVVVGPQDDSSIVVTIQDGDDVATIIRPVDELPGQIHAKAVPWSSVVGSVGL